VEIDYGPLAGLIGTWNGDKGMDVAPEPEGVERAPYFETTSLEIYGRSFEHTDENELTRV
jgi:hypothetical protein